MERWTQRATLPAFLRGSTVQDCEGLDGLIGRPNWKCSNNKGDSTCEKNNLTNPLQCLRRAQFLNGYLVSNLGRLSLNGTRRRCNNFLEVSLEYFAK